MPPAKKRQSAAQRRQAQRVRGVGPSTTPPATPTPTRGQSKPPGRDVRRPGPGRSAFEQLRRRRIAVLAIAALLVASLVIGGLSLFGPTASTVTAPTAAPIIVSTVQPAAPVQGTPGTPAP